MTEAQADRLCAEEEKACEIAERVMERAIEAWPRMSDKEFVHNVRLTLAGYPKVTVFSRWHRDLRRELDMRLLLRGTL